jgi:hypothetical protein
MKTRKQVLAEFQRMQNQMWGTFGQGAIEVRAYDQGNGYWSVTILVTRLNDALKVHDVWEEVKWTHHGVGYCEDDEAENEQLLAEFKEKFNLK